MPRGVRAEGPHCNGRRGGTAAQAFCEGRAAGIGEQLAVGGGRVGMVLRGGGPIAGGTHRQDEHDSTPRAYEGPGRTATSRNPGRPGSFTPKFLTKTKGATARGFCRRNVVRFPYRAIFRRERDEARTHSSSTFLKSQWVRATRPLCSLSCRIN